MDTYMDMEKDTNTGAAMPALPLESGALSVVLHGVCFAPAGERAVLIARYEDVMRSVHPVRADGSVLFPFRRLFFILTV